MPQDRPDIPLQETVDVHLRSAVVITNAPLVVRAGGEDITVPAGDVDVVEIELVAPANWPPLAGDVWQGNAGKLWFCKLDPSGEDPARLRMYVHDNSEPPMGIQSWKNSKRPVTRLFRASVPA